MLDLKNLISITPIPEEVKQQLIVSAETSADKKLEIESFCWETILSDVELKKQDRIAQIMDEIAQGNREYSKEDIEKVDEEVFSEINSKMEGLNMQDEIQEVRERLQQQTPTPPKTS